MLSWPFTASRKNLSRRKEESLAGSGVNPFRAIGCENTLGEGVVWDDRQNAVLWTDIEEKALYRSAFPFEDHERFDAPWRVGSFGLVEGRTDRLVVAFDAGFALFDYETGKAEVLDRPTLPRGARFNDGRVDRAGVFWAGLMIEDETLRAKAEGGLFRLADGDRAEQVIDRVKIPNSLCWSPDGATMYFADTPERVIWAFDFDGDGPSKRRVFARTPEGAFPDGSTVDADGCLWNAQWDAGRVVRYAPDGRVDLVVEIPAPHTTCVAFGGPELSHLIVTSARAELDPRTLAAAPNSGSLFVFTTPFKGIAEARWSPGRASDGAS